jgi:hypothetical protein
VYELRITSPGSTDSDGRIKCEGLPAVARQLARLAVNPRIFRPSSDREGSLSVRVAFVSAGRRPRALNDAETRIIASLVAAELSVRAPQARLRFKGLARQGLNLN